MAFITFKVQEKRAEAKYLWTSRRISLPNRKLALICRILGLISAHY